MTVDATMALVAAALALVWVYIAARVVFAVYFEMKKRHTKNMLHDLERSKDL
jgi:hypothetical protein